MILIIQHGKVFATHADKQKDEITFALYPQADAILHTVAEMNIQRGDADPRLTHPEYIVGASAALSTIYATLTFSGGDGKTPIIGVKPGHATKGVLQIAGDLRATPDAPGLPVNINFAWRITIRQIISEADPQTIGSFPVDGCQVANNQIAMIFDPEALGIDHGIYMISDRDFTTISGAAFGLPSDYQVKLVGGNKIFKVLK